MLEKALRMGRGAVMANLFGTRTPLNVMLSVTNRCLSRCAYCKIPTRSQREMTTAEICNLFDQMKAAGTVRVGLWGGEPLVRKDIGRIVDHARSLDFYVSLDTNGYLVPQKLPELEGLDHIVVAVKDLEAAAERYRGFGFTLKPGRPHANGIRNLHVKFPDGTEIELLTVDALEVEVPLPSVHALRAAMPFGLPVHEAEVAWDAGSTGAWKSRNALVGLEEEL